jgi:endoglycosylceramidase
MESPDTRFVVDACGRVVILRGVNVEGSAKGSTQTDRHLPSSDLDDQETLHRWGWNAVRFLVFWGAIEPSDGTFDEDYLDDVEEWLDWYADNDIFVVLDMHQDLYGWAVGGNGAPDWAVNTGGLTPGVLEGGQPWYLQGADPAVQAAYQSFWNPAPGDRDLKEDYLEAVAHLAGRFADHPAVIGYDVMNEPVFANGDLAATLAIQADAAAGNFVNDNLTEFMQGGIDAVRRHDRDAWVMAEPTSLLNAFPYPGDLDFETLTDRRDGPPRLAYAGHLYQQQVHDGLGYPPDDPYLETWERYRTDEARRMDAALWIGEWGGGPDQDRMDDYVREFTDMADRAMAGWAWWSWDPGGWSPVAEDGTTTAANGERLLRVQPRAVAGVPVAFTWDGDERVFTMTWTDRPEVTAPTELAVPTVLFSDGIEVVVDGEAVDPSWDRDRAVLELPPTAAAEEHVVCIQPAGGDECRHS